MDAKIVFDDYTTGANNGPDDITAKVMLLGSGGGGGATTLNQLNDVTLSSIQNKQVLKYNSTAGKWVNANEDLPNLDDLKNVNLSNPANGQVLKYNSSNNRWVNSDEESGVEDLSDLSDVTVNSPTNKQVLKYNSSTGKWTNSDEESGVEDLNDLSDVNISSPSNNQVLKYDSTNSEWVNGSVPSGASNLSDLNDVDISTPTAGQVLVYDDTEDVWVNGDAGNSSEQVISMADYLALTDAERNNGTSYYIYDAVNEGREIQPVIYSLEEREIGVWTDGKPLYQKTFYYDNQTTIGDGYTAIATLSGIDYIVSLTGNIVDTSSNNNSYSLPYAFNNKTTSLYYDNNVIGIRVNNDTWGPDWDIVVTIQYTKTTDIAGSGNFVPSGVPAVHYDENEKIIGTWFGETLYEKTVTINTLLSGADQKYNHGISNIDKIVGWDSIFVRSNGVTVQHFATAGNGYKVEVVSINRTQIGITTESEIYNTFTNVYITIRYTKSS